MDQPCCRRDSSPQGDHGLTPSEISQGTADSDEQPGIEGSAPVLASAFHNEQERHSQPKLTFYGNGKCKFTFHDVAYHSFKILADHGDAGTSMFRQGQQATRPSLIRTAFGSDKAPERSVATPRDWGCSQFMQQPRIADTAPKQGASHGALIFKVCQSGMCLLKGTEPSPRTRLALGGHLPLALVPRLSIASSPSKQL